MGFAEHGLCSAAKRIKSEVSDPLYQSISEQTGMGATSVIVFLLNIL